MKIFSDIKHNYIIYYFIKIISDIKFNFIIYYCLI